MDKIKLQINIFFAAMIRFAQQLFVFVFNLIISLFLNERNILFKKHSFLLFY